MKIGVAKAVIVIYYNHLLFYFEDSKFLTIWVRASLRLESGSLTWFMIYGFACVSLSHLSG